LTDLERTVAELEQRLSISAAEREELLLQQAASAEILKVINNSRGNLAAVFDAILEKATLLCGAGFSALAIYKGGDMHEVVTHRGAPPALAEMVQAPVRLGPETGLGRLVRGESFVHILDAADDEGYRLRNPVRVALVEIAGARTYLSVPIRKDDVMLGSFTIYRREVRPFSPESIALLQSFATQAAIAMENARLFNETQEALEQQTATADVLKVISRSAFDLDSVMNTLAQSAAELCKSDFSALYLRQGELLVAQGLAHTDPAQADFVRRTPLRADSSTYVGRTLLSGSVRNIADYRDETEAGLLRKFAEMLGFTSILYVPLMRDTGAIGVFALARKRPGQFSQREVELVQTFADQAVIAIENARLFDEVQTKTADLTEALAYQTGSANILRVIASSPSDVTPVLQAIVESACELCEAYDAIVVFEKEGELQMSAHHGPIPHNRTRWPSDRSTTSGRAIADQRPVHVHDVLSEEGLEFPTARALSILDGCRTLLSVPLLREGESIGAILLRRSEVHPFSGKQIALLQTFADQAVIAIKNARLFDEVQARTRDLQESLQQQTATADVLKVISRSAFDLDAVMNTLARSASELCGATLSGLLLREGDVLVMKGTSEIAPELEKSLREARIPIDDTSYIGRAVLHGEIGNVPDFDQARSSVRFFQERLGFKSILIVPLMREGRGVGVFALARDRVGEYSPRQVDLVQTFADQAVIALENVRLFDEVQARTRELATSLDELRTAQDRLVQTEKLASLGQLTAGIAHEIKNPLNFVNNFAALSAELTDELDETLVPAPLDQKMRGEVGELTQMLKSNLEKVVQHGKRADSIVKNMLLHSREGSGERRASDLNALVSESLNLAYHGARAERSDFNISLEQDLDPDAGAVEVYPQELTRALLNLISNGFYAAVRRKMESGGKPFEPVLSAATKNAGSAVEIRIRDNGAGIPAEIREKIFNPFFTTKPTGEGTGLGLSMAHDIVVKQHGGRIDVETEPGSFTEFIITLPRANGTTRSRQPE
jgi:two-component system, NtrC family, sensor kinase